MACTLAAGANRASVRAVTNPPVSLDPASLTASAGDRSARLNRREFALLQALCAGNGETVPHHELLTAVWGPHAEMPNLRVAIGRLRRKLEADPELPTLILTNAGAGYRLGQP
jgi:two-component system, OmpR family, KDP operon response regulator KdpE